MPKIAETKQPVSHFLSRVSAVGEEQVQTPFKDLRHRHMKRLRIEGNKYKKPYMKREKQKCFLLATKRPTTTFHETFHDLHDNTAAEKTSIFQQCAAGGRIPSLGLIKSSCKVGRFPLTKMHSSLSIRSCRLQDKIN